MKDKKKESIIYPDKFHNALNNITDAKLDEYISEYNIDSETFSVSIRINEEPDQYVMARHSYRTKHFYNPKQHVEDKYKKAALDAISKEDYDKIQSIISCGKMYNIDVALKFYIRTPKNLNIKQFILSEKCVRKPIAKRDCDNMAKLFFDAMSGIFYPDDCYITGFRVDKYNSMTPRIEATFTYTTYNENNKKSQLQE